MVTGATGLTGSHTVRALLAAGYGVNALVRSPEKAHQVFTERPSYLEIVRGDIGESASVRDALRECNAVVHCAATVAVGQKKGDPDDLMETNVDGVRNVIDTALRAGIDRIVHVSSLATLFRGDGTTLDEDSEPRDSKHAYGRSKAAADRYVRSLQADGRPVKIVYPAAIIGPDDPGLSESMLALRTFIEDFVPLTSAGMQFLDARDLAFAHRRMVEAAPGPQRILASGHFLTWSELARMLEDAVGRELRTIRIPAPVLRGLGRVLDLARRVVPIELPLTAEAAAYVTRWDPVPSSPALAQMGVTFRPVEESLSDAVRWMQQAGYL
jgi:nucleoside-diphosphate-sugar epimerase